MRCRKRVLTLLVAGLVLRPALAGPGVQNGAVHDGQEVDCDLPPVLRVRNTVGINGMGLCVWASWQMAANYQNCRELSGMFDAMRRRPGGGWPDRLDRVMREMAPGVKYRQYLGTDLAFIRQGIEGGRPVCVTYGYGELYGMKTIAHMVLCVGMNDRYTAVLDNNDPGHVWWMTTEEFRRRFVHPGGQGWACYLLTPPPPPVPTN